MQITYAVTAGRGEPYMGRQGCRRCEAAEARLLRRRNRQMLVDWRSAAQGPDLIYAGMVHVDPEPGIAPPPAAAGGGRPEAPGSEPAGPWRQEPEDHLLDEGCHRANGPR